MDKTLIAPTRKISRYRIDKTLGSGAMGMVYLGFDTQIERAVAIKVLHPHLRLGESGAELEKRFIQEARAAARCLHPNIVTIFDFGIENDVSFIVMEYVDGTELKAHLKNHTIIPLSSSCDICIQVLEALSHAHENGVIHRDIKPANIILLRDGTVKVSDFGVARLDSSDLTGTGLMIGTPNYMSPEAFRGKAVDLRSDLYSVGVLFFELLCFDRPDREQPLSVSLKKIDNVQGLSTKNIRSIKAIVNKALQRDPNSRYQNAQDFIQALKNIEDVDFSEATAAEFPTLVNNFGSQPDSKISNVSTSQWSGDFLKLLEQSLAEYLGPMAKLLIKKESKGAENPDSLVSLLANHIPDDKERTQFVKNISRSGMTSYGQSILQNSLPGASESTGSQGLTSSQETSLSLSPEMVAKITQALTFYIGPLAGRMVNKAMRSAAEPSSLVSLLAEQIPDEKEKMKFIKQVKRYI